MKQGISSIFKTMGLFLLALSIPGLLILNAVQSKKFKEQEDSVLELEEKQSEFVEQNKKLITEIGVLSSSDRIEKVAENELGMRKAESNEIVRVEMRNKK
ncbi:cell division protein FtsL [Treponema peruense]|uniref:Cell division protein FtsL n=1 Tax=Treponema peruense TaxID=2787628 RepID=A0A7T3RBV0_9SPIR|nr:cell division protein FtsL [Treponema peruense]QQA00259.1 cell division protein FtsL [Treponema peruense]